MTYTNTHTRTRTQLHIVLHPALEPTHANWARTSDPFTGSTKNSGSRPLQHRRLGPPMHNPEPPPRPSTPPRPTPYPNRSYKRKLPQRHIDLPGRRGLLPATCPGGAKAAAAPPSGAKAAAAPQRPIASPLNSIQSECDRNTPNL